jgi:hypothetical protein
MSTVIEPRRISEARPTAAVRAPAVDATQLEEPTTLQRTRWLIANPWKNYLLPAVLLRKRLARSQSPLIAESLARPGGWRSMEIIYRNNEPLDWFDRQALRDNPVSMACRNRRKIVTRKLAELIARYAADGDVTILGVGAGPGRHVQSALVESAVAPSRVTAYLIDRDDSAFGYGRHLALSFGIARSVHFLRGDACRVREALPDVSAQIVKLVGLVEYLSDAELVELLRALRDVMSPGASLLTHGLIDPYGSGRFLARVFNLRHRRRTGAHMATLLESVGLRPVDCAVEPAGVYPIITAVRDPD